MTALCSCPPPSPPLALSKVIKLKLCGPFTTGKQPDLGEFTQSRLEPLDEPQGLLQAAKDLGVQQVNQASQTQEGLTESPALDEPMRQFVAKALQQKCCKAELEEGHEKLGILRAKNEKWEQRRTKFILKVNAGMRIFCALT